MNILKRIVSGIMHTIQPKSRRGRRGRSLEALQRAVLESLEVRTLFSTLGTANIGYIGETQDFTVGVFDAPVASYGGLINWGDDTTSSFSVETISEGLYAVVAYHTYHHEGPYAVVTEITPYGSSDVIDFVVSFVDVRRGADRGQLMGDAGHDYASGVLGTFEVTSSFAPTGGAFSVSAETGEIGYWFSQTLSHGNGVAQWDESDGTVSASLSAEGEFTVSPTIYGGAFSLGGYSVWAEWDASLDVADSWSSINGAHELAASGAFAATDEKEFDGANASYYWHHTEMSSEMAVTGSGIAMPRTLVDGLAREDARQWDWELAHQELAGTFTFEGTRSISTTIYEEGDHSSDVWSQNISGSENFSLTETGGAGVMEFAQTLEETYMEDATVDGNYSQTNFLYTTFSVSATSTSVTNLIRELETEELAVNIDNGLTDVRVESHFFGNLNGGYVFGTINSTATYAGDTTQIDLESTVITGLFSSDVYADNNGLDFAYGTYSAYGEAWNFTSITSVASDSSQVVHARSTTKSDTTIEYQGGDLIGDGFSSFASHGTVDFSQTSTVVNQELLAHSTTTSVGTYENDWNFNGDTGDYAVVGNDFGTNTINSDSANLEQISNSHGTVGFSDYYNNAGNTYSGDYENTANSDSYGNSTAVMSQNELLAHTTVSGYDHGGSTASGNYYSGEYETYGSGYGFSESAGDATNLEKTSHNFSSSSYSSSFSNSGNDYEGSYESSGDTTTAITSTATMTQNEMLSEQFSTATVTGSYEDSGDTYSGDYTHAGNSHGNNTSSGSTTVLEQTSYNSSSSTFQGSYHNTGNNFDGEYHNTAFSTSTSTSTATLYQNELYSESTAGESYTGTQIESGNFYSGDYTHIGSDHGRGNSHGYSTNLDQTIYSAGTSTFHDSYQNTGNDYDGNYNNTLFSTATSASSTTMVQNDLLSHATASGTDTGSYTDSGNFYSGDYTSAGVESGTASAHGDSTNNEQTTNSSGISDYHDSFRNTGNEFDGTYHNTLHSTATSSSTSTLLQNELFSETTSANTDTGHYTDSGNFYSGDYTNIGVENGTSSWNNDSTHEEQITSNIGTSDYHNSFSNAGNDFDGNYHNTLHFTSTSASTATLMQNELFSETTSGATDTGHYTDTGNFYSGDYINIGVENGNAAYNGDATNQERTTSSMGSSDYQDSYRNTGNEFDGNYNNTFHSTTSSSSTSTMTQNELFTESTSSGTNTDDSTATGNFYTGSYVVIGSDHGTSNSSGSSTDLQQETHSSGTSNYQESYTNTGNDFSGDYDNTLHSTVTGSSSSSLTQGAVFSQNSSEGSDTGDYTYTGNSYSGNYAEIGVEHGFSSFNSDSIQQGMAWYAPEPSVNTDLSTTSHGTSSYSDSYTNTGNEFDGTYSNTGISTVTISSTSTMSSPDTWVVNSSISYDAAASTQLTSYGVSTADYNYSGDSISGDYTNIDHDTGSTTSTSIETRLSLETTTDGTATYSNSSTATGDGFSGEFSVTGLGGSTVVSHSTGTMSSHGFTSDAISTSSYTHTNGGNSNAGTQSGTDTSDSDGTVITFNDYGGGWDTQTIISTASSSVDSYSENFSGAYDSTSFYSSSSTVHESGSRGNDYTLDSTISSSGSSTESGNSFSGDYGLHTESNDETHTRRYGTDGSGNSFDITQVRTAAGYADTAGNYLDRNFNTDAVGSETLITSESNSGASASLTLTETVTVDSSLHQMGFPHSASYSTSEWGNDVTEEAVYHTHTSLTESGYNSEGTFELVQTSSESLYRSDRGDTIANVATIDSTGNQTYSVEYHFTPSGTPGSLPGGYPYSLFETGTRAYSRIEIFNGTSGEASAVETGSDEFTLTEYNEQHDPFYGPYALYNETYTLTGTDNYTETDYDNYNNGNYSHTVDIEYTGYTRVREAGGIFSTSYPTGTSNSVVSGDGTSAFISYTGDAGRYGIIAPYGLSINPTGDAGSGLSGIASFSTIGPMIRVQGYFAPATGQTQTVGEGAYKYCFAAGTRVLMADGTSQAIEKLETGQLVLAAPDNDPEAPTRGCRILQVFHNDPARIFEVKVADEIIRTTAGHPFYVRGRGWVKVKELMQGDELRTQTGTFLNVQRVVDTGNIESVFNLEVEADHTYFIALSTNGVWVHNASLSELWADYSPFHNYFGNFDRGVKTVRDGSQYAGHAIEDASLKSGNSYIASVGGSVSGGLQAAANILAAAGTLESHPVQTFQAVQEANTQIALRALNNGDSEASAFLDMFNASFNPVTGMGEVFAGVDIRTLEPVSITNTEGQMKFAMSFLATAAIVATPFATTSTPTMSVVVNSGDRLSLTLAPVANETQGALNVVARSAGLTIDQSAANQAALLRQAAILRNDLIDVLDVCNIRTASGQLSPAVVGAVNTETGQVGAGATLAGRYLGGECAEWWAGQAVGISPAPNSPILFTPAIRPRTGGIVPVCVDCQADWGTSAFGPNAILGK